jgi:hypothetical protein
MRTSLRSFWEAVLRSGTVWVLLFASGCSPSFFSGNTSDPALAAQKNSRPPSPGCNSFQLSSKTLTPKDFRSLVQCFNANQSIEPLANLFGKMSDEDLSPVVRALNVGLLEDEEGRSESFEILKGLKESGSLDLTVSRLGGILKNHGALTDVFSGILDDSLGGRIRLSRNEAPPETAYQWVNLFRRIQMQPSYLSFRKKMLEKNISLDEEKRLIRAFQGIASTLEKSAHFQKLRTQKSSDEWIRIFRRLITENGRDTLSSVSGSLNVIHQLTQQNARHLSTVLELAEVLESPVSCMQGGRVFSAPWTDITREFKFKKTPQELRSFVTDFAATVGLVIQDFCAVPKSFYSVFPNFYRIVATNWGEQALQWVKVLSDEDVADDLSRLLVELRPSLDPFLDYLGGDQLLLEGFLLITTLSDQDIRLILDGIQKLSVEKDGTKFSDQSTAQAGKVLRSFFEWLDPGATLAAIEESEALFIRSKNHPWYRSVIRVVNLKSESRSLPQVPRKELEAALAFLYEISQDGRATSLLMDLYQLFQKKGESTPEVLTQENWKPGKSIHSLSLQSVRLVGEINIQSDRDRACLRLNYREKWADQFDDYFKCLGSDQSEDSPYAGVTALEKEGLFQPLVELFSKWPWNAKTFQTMLPGFSGFILSGDLASILGSVKSFSTSLLSPVVSAFSGKINAEPFFQHLGEWFKSRAHFQDLADLIQMDDRSIPDRINGRSALPSLERFHAFLQGKECLMNAGSREDRIQEILYESKTFAVGEQKNRLKGIYSWIRAPGFSRFLEGVFRATELPNEGGASGAPRLSAEELLAFLHDNSSNAELVSTYSFEQKDLEVRLLTGLEQLEFLLNSANFKLPTYENFAQKFIGDVALAWGDEPRERWPDEIKRLYPNGRPPTLDEVISNLRNFLTKYERLAGLPKVKNCDSSVAEELPTDPVVKFQPLAFAVPSWVKGRLFNIHQTLPFIEKNRTTGMRIVREVAFQFWRTDSVDVLLNLGNARLIHAVSAFFSYRNDSIQRRAESVLLTRVLNVPTKEAEQHLAFLRAGALLLPEVDLSKIPDDEETDLSKNAAHQAIDSLLFVGASVGESLLNEVLFRLGRNLTEYENEWRVVFKRFFDSNRVSEGNPSETLISWGRVEKMSRAVFHREDQLKETAPLSRLVTSWGTDLEAIDLFLEVIRLTLKDDQFWKSNPLGNVTIQKSEREVLSRNLKTLVQFLAEPDGTARGRAARDFREKVLSDGLQGANFQRWISFFQRDPEAAAKSLRGLMMGLGGENFKTFLMTAGRQLPH